MDDIQIQFSGWLNRIGIRLSDAGKQLEQFEMYYRLLVEWNEKMNLTGITERAAVYEKHFYDSLTVAGVSDFDKVTALADIGSGAGFPSLPLKIIFPHLRVTIVDALAKRMRFLQEVVSALGLTDVSCLHGRAEEIARMPAHRDVYDLVTARAVARLASLNELCLPFVRTGGSFVAMKGSGLQEELEESQFSVQRLNGKVLDVLRLTLPNEGAERHLVVISKTGATPKVYPRKPGTPLKQPLLGTSP